MGERKSEEKDVQGEGDYRSARRYRDEIGKFMQEKSRSIEDMARDAERAVDGQEGRELKHAEDKGKSKARH